MTQRGRSAWLATVVLLLGAGAGESVPPGVRELRLPGLDWSLTLDLPGYVLDASSTSDNGNTTMLKAGNEQSGMIVSVYLEREKSALTSKQCRDKYWKPALKSPLKKTGIKAFESETMAFGEYTVIVREMKDFRQRNLNAYLGVGDVCVDVHLSRVNPTEADSALFSSVIDSVTVRRD